MAKNKDVFMRIFLIMLAVFMITGCSSTSSPRGTGGGVNSAPAPVYQYFEMVDKTEFPAGNEEKFLMHWQSKDEYCLSFIRGKYFRNQNEILETYRNCMGRNNFRLIPAYNYQDVADRNREEYGFTYIIEKSW